MMSTVGWPWNQPKEIWVLCPAPNFMTWCSIMFTLVLLGILMVGEVEVKRRSGLNTVFTLLKVNPLHPGPLGLGSTGRLVSVGRVRPVRSFDSFLSACRFARCTIESWVLMALWVWLRLGGLIFFRLSITLWEEESMDLFCLRTFCGYLVFWINCANLEGFFWRGYGFSSLELKRVCFLYSS